MPSGSLLAWSTCYTRPSQGHYLWATAQTLCLIWPCVCHFKVTQKAVSNTLNQGRMCDNKCHWTLAEDDTHIMAVFTPSSRAHSLSVFLVLPVGLSVLQIGFLVFFLAEASLKDWQKPELKCEAATDKARNSSWILRSGWTTSRTSIFESAALLGRPGWIPHCWRHSNPLLLQQGVTANWDGIKLFLQIPGIVSEPPVTSIPNQ